MIGLIQRVHSAKVYIDNTRYSQIGNGLLLFLGIEKADTDEQAEKLLHKVLNYRVFEDADGKMNHSLLDINGELLIVSQFTLPANTKKGMCPSFASAAQPHLAQMLYNKFISLANEKTPLVKHGVFAADMDVELVNNGPVTFWLQVN